MKRLSWSDLERQVLKLRRKIRVPKDMIPHPLRAGYRTTPFAGRQPSYAKPFGRGRFHVEEVDGQYCIHYDRYDPERYPLAHLLNDAPRWFFILSVFGFVFLLLLRYLMWKVGGGALTEGI